MESRSKCQNVNNKKKVLFSLHAQKKEEIICMRRWVENKENKKKRNGTDSSKKINLLDFNHAITHAFKTWFFLFFFFFVCSAIAIALVIIIELTAMTMKYTVHNKLNLMLNQKAQQKK